jgi:hypothetical protein
MRFHEVISANRGDAAISAVLLCRLAECVDRSTCHADRPDGADENANQGAGDDKQRRRSETPVKQQTDAEWHKHREGDHPSHLQQWAGPYDVLHRAAIPCVARLNGAGL